MLKTGRTLAMTLAAWGCGLTTTCMAQTYSAGDVVTLPASAGGYDYSSGAFGDSGPAYGGVSAAGYQGMPANCPPQPGYGAACEPQPTCWWKRPLLISPGLLKPPRGAFFRTEYLLWEIEELGNVPLGADNFFANPAGVTRPFIAPDGTLDFAYVPRLDEIQFRDNSGLRLTYGIPLKNYGALEFSGWLLEQASDHYEFGTIRGEIPATFFLPTDPTASSLPPLLVDSTPGTSFLLDGQDFIRNHEEGLNLTYKSDMWGADAKYVVDSLSPPGEGLKLKPLFGLKYVGFQEGMYQTGTSQGIGEPAIISSITSNTSNTILGGTVGLRAELVHRWFIAGIQPAVTFAGNIAESRVASERFLDNNDPRSGDDSSDFEFSPVLDLNTYVRVCLSENLRLSVGYDAFWLSRVYRAAKIIDYEAVTENGVTRSDIRTKKQVDHVAVEGLSVGLEYIF
ncbi:MAG: BBP7 family outer membrane beta-barrel protein [Planctomycetota bacterium]|nr:BBP7 family outer membrane beta-barrel protein [Planctomycetaceae bacterium]MDQ3332566.1 BBP7 family outer membrane beta-barrel protein [Planctomycetota bacterium]